MSGREPLDPAQREELALWLERAAEDLAVARLLVDKEYVLSAAFHAQQALEKLLKALLIGAGQEIRRTHDLDALATQAGQFWPVLISTPFALASINRWYLRSRYPDTDETPPSLSEIGEALREIDVLLAATRALMFR